MLLLTTATCTPTKESRQATSQTAPLLELRVAYAESSGDRDRFQFGDTVVYLARAALLADPDIIAARPLIAGDSRELLLDLRFKPDAGKRLAAGLKAHVGGKLAVLLASRVRAVVPIASPVGSAGELTLNTNVSGAEAEWIAQRVRAKWPDD